MRLNVTVAATVAAMYLATPALAHHSFAMFDREKTITMNGVVKELEFTNPHAFLDIIVVDEKTGQPVQWLLEMPGVGQISKQGWTPDSVKPGDRVMVTAHPLRDGSHGGEYVSVTLPNGRILACSLCLS